MAIKQTVSNLYTVSAGTQAVWAAADKVINYANMILFETDTGRLKISTGDKTYSQLDYIHEEVFTSDMKALFDNANAANGVVVLNGSGKIEANMLPVTVGVKPAFVADITARDAIAVADRTGLVIVADATDDTTVTAGAAGYVWDATGAEWIKVYEGESLDVDYTNFVKDGDSIERLADGSTYVKYTATERAQLIQLAADLAALQTTVANNYAALTGRADTLDGVATDHETRMTDTETSITDLETHALRDDTSYVYNAVGPEYFTTV